MARLFGREWGPFPPLPLLLCKGTTLIIEQIVPITQDASDRVPLKTHCLPARVNGPVGQDYITVFLGSNAGSCVLSWKRNGGQSEPNSISVEFRQQQSKLLIAEAVAGYCLSRPGDRFDGAKVNGQVGETAKTLPGEFIQEGEDRGLVAAIDIYSDGNPGRMTLEPPQVGHDPSKSATARGQRPADVMVGRGAV